jgi:hypothetical protein
MNEPPSPLDGFDAIEAFQRDHGRELRVMATGSGRLGSVRSFHLSGTVSRDSLLESASIFIRMAIETEHQALVAFASVAQHRFAYGQSA